MRLLSLILMSCCLSACALRQDAGQSAERIAPDEVRLAQDIHLASDDWPQARWWTVYADPQLDGLVDYALRHAPGIGVARGRIDLAQSMVRLTTSATRPQGNLGMSIDRERVSGQGFLGPFAQNAPAMGLTGPWYTEATVGLGASYKLDLWGEERSRVDAAIGARNARLAEAAEVELEISTAVAQLYFEIQTLSRTTELLDHGRAIQADVVASHKARLDRGLESQTPGAEAAVLLTQMDQQITAARTRSLALREALRALVGAHADDLPPIDPSALRTAHAGVPRTLSYQLLARRPDLQALRWYVQASCSQIDAAKAAFYPSFDIMVFLGRNAIHTDDLWGASAAQYNLIPGLSLPIFDGGRLNADLSGARAQNRALVEQYNQAVLNAVRDVAVAGTQLQAAETQVRLQDDRVRQTRIVAASAEAHCRQGLYSRVQSSQAQLAVTAQETELARLRGEQVQASVELIRALGGGYVGQ